MRLGLATQDHHEVAGHLRLALVVQLDGVARGHLLDGHVDHGDGALDDLLARGDDGLRLLAAQHRLGDLGGVGEVREAGVVHLHAGGSQA